MTLRLLACASLLVVISANEARADARAECAASYDKTQTHRDHGELIEARASAAVCNAKCSPELAQECAAWLVEIDKDLPTIVVSALSPMGIETSKVRVLVDGREVATHLDGKPIPINPGPHTLRFEADGRSAEQKLTIARGERSRRVKVEFDRASASGGERRDVLSGERDPGAQTAAPVWAWVALGVGGASLVGGVVGIVGAYTIERPKLVQACGGSDFDRCPSMPPYPSGVRYDASRVAGGFLITLGTGGIAAGIVGVTVLRSSQGAAIVVPATSPGFTGIIAIGRF